MPHIHDLPSGMIWLCNSCKIVSNPIETSKEGKSHSKLGSKATAPANNTPNHYGLQTPASLTDTQIDSDLFSDDEPSAICPQMLTEKLNNVLKSQNEKICVKFTIGKFPHG